MGLNLFPEEGTSRGEPEVRYAIIGAAFGLLLVCLGRLVPFRIVSWPIIGIGVLFVVVMTIYTLGVLWQKVSPRFRWLLRKARGHIRKDPQLGTLTRELRTHCWEAALTIGDRTVDVIIAGNDEPEPALLARARDLVADFDTLERGLDDFLAREAKEEALESPELAAEIRALRVSAIRLQSPDQPDHVGIDFDGLDEMRYWYCDYVDGELSGLSFDS